MNLQILNPLRWRKSFLFLVLGASVLIWFALIDTYSLWTRYELYQRKVELQERNEQLKQETRVLQEKIDELESNPDLLERIAREQYGMRKEGETVYKIQRTP